jgi:hypothetical protein
MFIYGSLLLAQVPQYDTKAYCQELSEISGGSAQIEVYCREEEKTSKNNILNMSYSSKAMNYCQEIGKISGGSYSILEVCLKDEAEAELKLR